MSKDLAKSLGKKRSEDRGIIAAHHVPGIFAWQTMSKRLAVPHCFPVQVPPGHVARAQRLENFNGFQSPSQRFSIVHNNDLSVARLTSLLVAWFDTTSRSICSNLLALAFFP